MFKHYLFYLSTILPLWGLASVVVSDNGVEALRAANDRASIAAEMDDILLEISGHRTPPTTRTSRNVTTSMPCDPDLDPPTITLLVPNISVECSEGLPPALVPGIDITAFDDCDGDISSNIELLQSTAIDEDCSNDGVFQLCVYTYGVSDTNGSKTTVMPIDYN